MIQRKGIELFIPYCDGGFYVDYNYSPATPDVPMLRNGDPGSPGDDADVELLRVAARPEGDDLYEILSESAIDDIIEAVIEYEEGGNDFYEPEEDYTSDDLTLRDWMETDANEMEDQ